jgi:colicin import membrane protein
MSLALLAHLLLAGALTWGVSWKREATVTTVEAELWSALPQQAAPKLQEVPQPVQPKPVVQPAPEPEPAPVQAPAIVVEKEKPKPPKQKVEPKPETKPVAKPEPRANDATDAKKQAALKEAERLKNIERMAGLAGASGAASSPGTALQSSGPSGGYAGLIKGRVRPNLVFTSTVLGNPQVTVEVRLSPDGTILGRPRIVQSSGSKEWDEAVVRAFEKTEFLPRDNGKIWSPLVVQWRVND